MKMDKIDEIEKLAQQYQLLSKGVIDYMKYAHYAAVQHSTTIEGSTLTISQVNNLLDYGKTAKDKPYEHHQMVYDHYQALRWVIDKAQNKTLLSVDLIKEIGAAVMKNTGSVHNTMLGSYDTSKGEFRLQSVYADKRTFPNYQKVPDLVKQLCITINQRLQTAVTFQEKIETAFYLHFEFVSIHPFGDGNGRTSRLLMNYVQQYFDLPLGIVFRQDRAKYVATFEATRKHENIAIFYEFMFKQYKKFLKEEIKKLLALQ
jgi:Fic family protein